MTGGGSIVGNTTFTGGTLDPGSPTGTLTFAGNLTLTGASTLIMEIGGPNDRLAGIGTFTLGGQLTVVPVAAPSFTQGQTFNLFGFTTSSGSFANISLPFTANGWVWDTSQLGTTGVLTLTTITPVPEPSTCLLLAAGLGVMVFVRRRAR